MTLVLLYSLGVSFQLRVLLSVDLAGGRNDRERQQDVRSGERSTAEILAIIRRRSKLRFQEGEVGGVVLGQVRAVDLVGNTASDRLDEEGDGGVADVWSEMKSSVQYKEEKKVNSSRVSKGKAGWEPF